MGAIRFGDFLYDASTRLLTRNGSPVHLTPKAFDLLGALLEARPRALRKEELRERLWPAVVVDESNLKTLVAEIRAALGGSAAIRTVHRYGYAFGSSADSVPASTARLVAGDRLHPLRSGENVIGRDEECAVILDFTGISRRHAKVTVGEGTFVLHDLGSKNGTWKNEERVHEPVELRDGDRIRLGAISLVFRSAVRPVTTATLQASE